MGQSLDSVAARRVRTACLVLALMLIPAVTWPQVATSHAEERDEDDVAPSGDFLLGHGSARGTGVRVGPSRSGFNFTTDFAVSLADYQNTVARGDSRGVSLGMILETVLEAADEEGEYLPQGLRVDSRDEGASDGVSSSEVSSSEVSGSGAELPAESPFTAAVGSQYVRATDDPFSEVETVMGTLGLPGAVALEGGTSRATAGIVAEGQREGRGEAAFERVVLGGGAIVLEGLEWTAVHRSGAEDDVSASFTLGGIEVDGEPLPLEDLSTQGADGLTEAFDAANQVLSELGVFLESPQQVVNEDTGEVQMTPLKISLGPTETSRSLVGELSDGLQAVREPLADALIGAQETFGAVFLLYDVALGAFAGGGEVLLEIGGAQAVTGAQEFADPFGSGTASGIDDDFGEMPQESSATPEPATGGPSEAGSGPDLDGGPDAAAPPLSAEESGQQPPEEPVTSAPPTADDASQAVAAPAGSGVPTGRSAVLAAVVALLVAAGLGGADFLRLRRSQRTIPL